MPLAAVYRWQRTKHTTDQSLALLLCSDALPEKPKWAVQACHKNIPLATMDDKGSLKAVTLTLSLQLIQQREWSTTAVQNHATGNVFVYEAWTDIYHGLITLIEFHCDTRCKLKISHNTVFRIHCAL